MNNALPQFKCRVATPNDTVLNTECAFTFHSPYSTDKGILVSLDTFIGTVEELAGEGLFVRIVKKRIEKAGKGDSPANEPKKLGLGVEGGFESDDDRFEVLSTYSLVGRVKEGDAYQIVEDRPYNVDTKNEFDESLILSIESIINHSGLAVQQDLTVWQLDDDPIPVSKYASDLPFVDNGKMISPNSDLWKCEKSGSTENLWLNLSDGYIGGGRKNWDGTGGSNGALDHFNETGQKYPLVVKLGTITTDVESADCYSYAPDEDGPVKIPYLAEMLEKRGIKVSGMQKTVKSTAELEVELNATYAFDAITEAGATLVPVSGPMLQGLQNMGNSCYMNSVVQLLLSGTVSELANRYGGRPGASVTQHAMFDGCHAKDAISDLLCQTAKLSLALTTGTFAVPESILNDTSLADRAPDPKYRIQPRMFKHVVAGDHVDFRTGQQQDAAQYLLYMLEKLEIAEKNGSRRFSTEQCCPSSHLFAFRTNTRLVCSSDQKIKYTDSTAEIMLSVPVPMDKAVLQFEPEQKRHKGSESTEAKIEEGKAVPTISFSACLDSWAAEKILDDYRWPHLGNAVASGTSQCRFSNFPSYLLVQVQRYALGSDWTPQKLEINLDIEQEVDLTAFRSKQPHEGEDLVLDDVDQPKSSASAAPEIDPSALASLMDMGFTFNGCQRALKAVGGSDVEAAMNWVFEHNMDPDFNDPVPDDTSPITSDIDSPLVDEVLVRSLVDNLGCFSAEHVRAALEHTGGEADQAAEWLFSHMDDLDSAVAALSVLSTKAQSSSFGQSLPLSDGEGKYTMVGMVSHIGKHTGSGHYVAHLKRGDHWCIFNDEKVAISATPPFAHAYLYLFQRKDTLGSPDPRF